MKSNTKEPSNNRSYPGQSWTPIGGPYCAPVDNRQFKVVFDAIRSLMQKPEPKHRGIGFTAKIND